TNVLETTFRTDDGLLVLTDCLVACDRPWTGEGEEREPYRQLIRLARCEAGEVEVRVEFEPRFDYGLTTPQVVELDAGLACVYGGADALVFQCQLHCHAMGFAGRAGGCRLRAGEEIYTVLTYARPHQLCAVRLDAEEVHRRVEVTCRFWTA